MTTFKRGEVVDVTIRGVRIADQDDSSGSVLIFDEHGVRYPMPPQAAIERVIPANWPPRTGDLWRDENGMLYLAQQDWGEGVDLVDVAGEWVPPGELLHRKPTLVHREEES